MDDQDCGVPSGIYIYSLIVQGIRINKKMLLVDSHQNISHSAHLKQQVSSSLTQFRNSKVMSDQYLLRITGTAILTHELRNLQITGNLILDITVTRTVMDIDGNIYKIVKIGDQWWMAENLKVSRYRNGDIMTNEQSDSEWINLTTGARCIYDNNQTNMEIFGTLYNWHAVADGRNIAPEGWHVPSDQEWQTMVNYLGSAGFAGRKLKERGTNHWNSQNTGATNESGFTAISGGHRSDSGGFGDKSNFAISKL
ncbi:hypothetical protein BVY01_02105 [bacterium I07]|nr:hypothetical protein BVY01_02105 [bacterium I07]